MNRAGTSTFVPRASTRHVVVVTTSYPSRPGDPSGHFVAAEVRALRDAGERVTVLAPRVAGAGSVRDDGVLLLPAGDAFGWPGALARLRARRRRVFGVARFVRNAERRLRELGAVDRIVAHFVVPSAWPIACSRPGVPLEVVAHGSDVRLVERLPPALRRRIAQRLSGASLRAVSLELGERLRRALVLPRERLIEVRAAPLELGPPDTREATRAALGVDPAARLVVVVGRLIASKRVEVALAAARLVPRALTVVVGDGPERARLERSHPHARFVGLAPRERALAWVRAADVLLSASTQEGAPTVVREARALGTRVVALPAGDLATWSRTDAGLWLIEPDAEARA